MIWASYSARTRIALAHDVMDQLIIASLHERRINAAEGLEALDRETRRERHGVLLRDAHVVRPLREPPPEDVHARAAGHRRRDADDVAIGLGDSTELVGEDRR